MKENVKTTHRDLFNTVETFSNSGVSSLADAEPGFCAEFLEGISDLHIHAAPDVRERAFDELEFARQAKKAGYRSILYKSNEWSCHDRVYLIRKMISDFDVFGSLCMNEAYGDRVNVHAAQMAVQTTGGYCRCIWMPTQAAAYQHAYEKRPGKGIPVVSSAGMPLPEVVKIMEICAEADIIFATGHCSPQESIRLAEKAKEVGVSKFVVTHANSYIWRMTQDQIKKVIDLGAWVEYSFISNLCGPGTGVPINEKLSDAEFVNYVRINPDRSFITTDLGQVRMPHPIAGMRICIETLLKAGVSQKDVDQLVRVNPANLLNLKL